MILCIAGLLLLATGCHDGIDQASLTAAEKVYDHYAERTDHLTVSLVGNYAADDGHTYTAVVLQAKDEEGWEALCEEYDFMEFVKLSGMSLPSVPSTAVDSLQRHPMVVSVLPIEDYDEGTDFDSLAKAVMDSLGIDTSQGDTWSNMFMHRENEPIDLNKGGQKQSIDALANTNEKGYIFAFDPENRAVVLLFFSSYEELVNIAEHLKGSILSNADEERPR